MATMEYQDFRLAYFRVYANYERRLPDYDYSCVERLLRTVYGRDVVGTHMNRLAHELDALRDAD